MKFIQETNNEGIDRYLFECPACGNCHFITTKGGAFNWQWNGDMNLPTVKPSVRVRYNQVCGNGISKEYHCHFFISNGKFHYCNDSTHALAGKVVELQDWD